MQKQVSTLSKAAKEGDRAEVAQKADAVEKAMALESARHAFAGLSDAMIAYRADVQVDSPVVAYCSMVKHSWLQAEGPISNPYLGKSMPACGEFKTDTRRSKS